MVELTKRLGLDKSTLSRTIEGLVNIGLVERMSQPNDRRFNIISLTPKGQEIADRINHSNDEFYLRIFSFIGSDRHDEVINNFEELVQAMHKQRRISDE